MVEKPGSPNVASVSNGLNERNVQNAEAYQLYQKHGSYGKVAKQLGVSKSTVYRRVNAYGKPTSVQNVENPDFEIGNVDESSSLMPNEPVELIDDTQLKSTYKRLKMENAIKRMRTRGLWLDWVAENPARYHMKRDGHGSAKSEFERRMEKELEKIRDALKGRNESASILQAMKIGIDVMKQNQPPRAEPKGLGDVMKEAIAFQEILQKLGSNQQLSVKDQVELNAAKLHNQMVIEGIKAVGEAAKGFAPAIGTLLASKMGVNPMDGKTTQTLCPNPECQKPMTVPIPLPEKVKCPHCGNILTRSKEPVQEKPKQKEEEEE